MDRVVIKKGPWGLIRRMRQYRKFAKVCIDNRSNLANVINLVNSETNWSSIISEYVNFNGRRIVELELAWQEFIEITKKIQEVMKLYRILYQISVPTFEIYDK